MPALIGSAIAVALGFAATGVVATIATLAVQIALTVALSYVAGQLLRGSSPLPTPTDGQIEVRQPLSPRVKSYGTIRIAGALFWFEADGRTLYKGLAVNHGRIGEFQSFHIDENQVTIDGNGDVTSDPYALLSDTTNIQFRLGLPTETSYSELEAISGESELRGDGVATMLGIFENPTNVESFQNTYPGGEPVLRATIDASVVYDPRDADQAQDDPDTWTFTDNAVVCLMEYLFSGDGYGIAWDRIERNLDQWIEAMDVCDEEVQLLAGGVTRKYRVAGTYRLTDTPRDVVAKFESTCDGRVWVKRDGSIGVSVGKLPTNREDLIHIQDAQVTGYDRLTRGQDPLRAIVAVRGEYLSPDHDYREHEAEPWPTAADALDIGEERTTALDLLWVPSNSQARRLMKRTYMRFQARWHGTIHLTASVLELLDERYFRLTITELGIEDELFEVTRLQFDPGTLRGEVDVLSIDETIDDWEPEEEGDIEGGVFQFVAGFEKEGLTIDPISEGGAQVGEYVVIAIQSQGTSPALPAGYTALSGTPMVSSNLNMRIIGKLIDGTEGAVTVAATNGQILLQRFRGVFSAPTITNIIERAESSTFSESLDAADYPSQPFMVYLFGAANDAVDDEGFTRMVGNPGKADIEEELLRQLGSHTGHVLLAIFQAGEVPPSGSIILSSNVDVGSAQGIVAFTFQPGA